LNLQFPLRQNEFGFDHGEDFFAVISRSSFENMLDVILGHFFVIGIYGSGFDF
jgi:hypothetical protein